MEYPKLTKGIRYKSLEKVLFFKVFYKSNFRVYA